MDVIIDDQLPKRYAAKPKVLCFSFKKVTDCNKKDGEYWVPLIEKAYAKFFGGYKNTIGGDPTWALCNLTGGICLEVANFTPETIHQLEVDANFDLFEFLNRIQKEAVFATSNTENAGEDSTTHAVGQMGLVAGHAYAMLEVARVHFL